MKRGREVFSKGQVWIETVIYTLITLLLIGLVLSFVQPKIQEFRDRAVIEDSIGIIESIDNSIQEVRDGGAGNKRIEQFEISSGSLKIDSANDKIIFEIEAKLEYSEPGEIYSRNNIDITTEKKGEYNLITLTRNYSPYNITYEGSEDPKTLSRASTPYSLSVLSKGYIESKFTVEMSI